MTWVSAAWALLGVALATTACSGGAEESGTTAPAAPTTSSAVVVLDEFGLPPEARASNGGGAPRPPAYWAVWNNCAPDNRSAVAAANGGRDAGWFLVDDLLADPGLQLGDHPLATCEEAVALLQGGTAAGQSPDPVYPLAAQLLTAELNLGVGSETCAAAEEAAVGAHLVLSAAGFDGVSSSPLDAEAGGALPQLRRLLEAYNTGELCR
jgi:hypothetical protein